MIDRLLRNCVLLGLAVGSAACSEELPPPRRNVVLISIDSLRRDFVGAYGHRPAYADAAQAYTPAIDDLAARGIAFDDAWTSTSWTLPAHMTLMTGMPERMHGVETDELRLDPLRSTVAEVFQAAGWRTGGLFSGPYLDPRYGFERGFESYDSAMPSPESFSARIREHNLMRVESGLEPLGPELIRQIRDRQSHIEVTSPRVNELAEGFLDADDERPFFLFLHYFDAHYDHLPGTQDVSLPELFDPSYEGGFDAANWYFNEQVMDKQPPYARHLGDRDLGHVKAMYEAEIHWVDRHVQQIVGILKRRGMWDNTIVMLVSDHGDEFFDHQGIGHRSTLFPELCRIPMVLRVPDGPHGMRVPGIARMEDVAPTLLDYSGAGAALSEARGSSLRGLIRGQDSKEARGAVFRLYSGPHSRGEGLNLRDGWRNERWTVLRQFGPAESSPEDDRLHVQATRWVDGRPYIVFDRLTDPRELRPLSPDTPGYPQAIQAFCRAFELLEERAIALPRSPRSLLRLGARSAEEEAAIAALGYAGASELESEGAGMPELAPLPSPCAD